MNPRTLKAFYSDTFVLPLPEQHRFPMAKYRLLRERLLADGILAGNDLHLPDAISWDDLRLVHEATYVDAIANGTVPADAQRRIGFPCATRRFRDVERNRGRGSPQLIDQRGVPPPDLIADIDSEREEFDGALVHVELLEAEHAGRCSGMV